MAKSRGKKFETEVSRMLSTHPQVAYVYHPPDIPPAQLLRFKHRNPIDFYCYLEGGAGVVVECKSVKGTNLPFSRFPPHQWEALRRCSDAQVLTFVLLNHYGWAGRDGRQSRDGQRGRCWAVPFRVLAELREYYQGRRKSWPLDGFEIFSELKKITGSWEWEIGG